ncbi:MAG: sigma-70 family RNA polymerase sigma factor, partial [Planctomycetota bacterium]
MDSTKDPLFKYLRKPRRRRFVAVVQAYHEFVWRVAYRSTGNAEDSSDVCQDVFLDLILSPPDPESVSSPRGFLAFRALSRASRMQRASARRKQREEEYVRRLASEGVDANDIDALNAAIDALPDDLRTTMDLRYRAELSVAEIARTLGVSDREVRRRQEKARAELRRRLAGTAVGLSATIGSVSLGAELPSPSAALLERLCRLPDAAASLQSGLAAAQIAGSSSIPTVASGTSSLAPLGGLLLSSQQIGVAVAVSIVLFASGIGYLVWDDDTTRSTGEDSKIELADESSSERKGSQSEIAVGVDANPGSGQRGTGGDSEGSDATRTASLRGFVRDRNGKAVPDAKLWALAVDEWDATFDELGDLRSIAQSKDSVNEVRERYAKKVSALTAVTSDGEGGFEFFGLASTRHRLVVLHPRHSPRSDVLVENVPASELVVELDAALTIAGIVSDAGGVPIAGVSVHADRSDESRLGGSERRLSLL